MLVFSDESRFGLGMNDACVRGVWRTAGERFLPAEECQNKVQRFSPAVSVMVWGCIGFHGVWGVGTAGDL